MHQPIVVVLLASLALAGGCSRAKTLDGNGLEETLRPKVEQQLGTQGITVDCPDDEPAQAGATFQCTATSAAGKTMTIEITQTDDKGNVTYKVVGAG